ncbi:1-phosphatidylinositol-4-phosphate 5-kinase [Tremella mesenterica]|uniref:1-phosphatidylinositol-4-phosphate 5-kinase n=1 Tax=Tremella mesenterica TaxID=5217 RepID=A0A4Q1BBY9_TREME|nr:1-phosphatidylinositol-4-phosphate 5-kinase [Tremella mesenterica]
MVVSITPTRPDPLFENAHDDRQPSIDRSNGVSDPTDASYDAQAKLEAETVLKRRAAAHVNGHPTPQPSIEAFQLGPHESRVNPFHLLSHPNSSDPLPPLPPHLQALTSDDPLPSFKTDDPDTFGNAFRSAIGDATPNGQTPVHVTKVSSDSVRVVSGPGPQANRPRRLMKKVSNVFKKDNNGDVSIPITNNKPLPGMPIGGPMDMQRPPPSPPASDDGVYDQESQFDASEHDQDLSSVGNQDMSLAAPSTSHGVNGSGQLLSPVPERNESSVSNLIDTLGPSLVVSPNITSEPIQMPPSPTTTLSPPTADHAGMRRASAPSMSDRIGLTVSAGNHRQSRNTSAGPVEDKRSPPILANGPGRSDSSKPHPIKTQRQDSTGSLPPGDYLHPSSALTNFPRISRRSTNPAVLPSTSPSAPRSPLLHSHSVFAPSSPIRGQTNVPGVEGAALDSDILAQAETIRRERLERRQKKASAKEHAEVGAPGAESMEKPSAPIVTTKHKDKEEARVLVGNLIGEDHVNYVLMYNMLTGIRIGVSRCQAKIKRPLTAEDYTARHKFSFDMRVEVLAFFVGNELTPSARYDFKFKDYAPWVFRELRDEHFHLDPADYLLSLTAKYILSELGSPGKSGSFFYFSRDYRFIIKTISHSEHKFLRSILFDYHAHVKANPHTLLSRFYGLHRVKLPRGRKIHFVIMNNLFPPHRDVHETYDLKGSAFGREYPEEKAAKNPRAVLKDKNWVNRGRSLELGPEKRALLSEQLKRDMDFLKSMKVMDYSLLVGIHNMERGNKDNLRENQLTVFHPDVTARRKASNAKGPSDASNVRKAVRSSDPKMLDVASQLPPMPTDRSHFLFYQDEGGLRATDEQNQDMDVIYYLGVIDICTPYNTVKKLEHFWKSMTEDRHTISCVEPVTYGQRFLNFLLSVMRGGNPALRPEGLRPNEPIVTEAPVGETPESSPEPEMKERTRIVPLSDPAQISESGMGRISSSSGEKKVRREISQERKEGIV